MEQVAFTRMADGSREDYKLLQRLEPEFFGGTARRVIEELERQGKESLPGYKVSRLDHALQTATRALRDGADTDWIVAALLHDIGDGLAPQNHDKVAAEIVRPFLREECTWTVEHHGAFQMLYYAHHYGWDRNARDAYRDSRHFATCDAFCARWDQESFDPGYRCEPLSRFAPLVEEVFARKAYDPAVIRAGVAIGLP
ncbi:MAG TPA: HD domain-containing protein [Stellaceae bacterium]|nr:HD domain-containing protein [Stellaceae bacterium]